LLQKLRIDEINPNNAISKAIVEKIGVEQLFLGNLKKLVLYQFLLDIVKKICIINCIFGYIEIQLIRFIIDFFINDETFPTDYVKYKAPSSCCSFF